MTHERIAFFQDRGELAKAASAGEQRDKDGKWTSGGGGTKTEHGTAGQPEGHGEQQRAAGERNSRLAMKSGEQHGEAASRHSQALEDAKTPEEGAAHARSESDHMVAENAYERAVEHYSAGHHARGDAAMKRASKLSEKAWARDAK